MTRFAGERVSRGEAMPGVVVIGAHVPIGQAIEAIVLFATGSTEGEWEGQVVFLPW